MSIVGPGLGGSRPSPSASLVLIVGALAGWDGGSSPPSTLPPIVAAGRAVTAASGRRRPALLGGAIAGRSVRSRRRGLSRPRLTDPWRPPRVPRGRPRSPPLQAGSSAAPCRWSSPSSSPASTSSRRRSCWSWWRPTARPSPGCRPGAGPGGTRASGSSRGRGRADPGRRRRLETRPSARRSTWSGAKTSAGGPSATTAPPRMTTIRAKWSAANSMSWVIATTVRPGAARRRRRSPRPDATPGSVLAGRRLVEDEGGRVHRQHARPGRRACAATGRGRTGWSSRTSSRPTAASAPVDGPADDRRRTPEVARPERRPRARPTGRTAGRRGSGRRTRPSPRARGPAASRMSAPSSRTRPLVGRRRPLRCFTSVVLPEPFWPTIATDSPGSIASDTPRSASTPVG